MSPASGPRSLGVSRREFLARVRTLCGLVLIAGTKDVMSADEAPKYGADGMPHGWSDDPLAFVALGEDGIVTIVVHRSEMGQGVRKPMALIVADELEADWSRAKVMQADADELKHGNHDTHGSRSVRTSSGRSAGALHRSTALTTR